MNIQKICALLLLFALLLSACSAPASEGSEEGKADLSSPDPSGTAEEAAEPETEEDRTKYDPHLEAVDYAGAAFNVLYNYGNDLEPNKDFTAEELTGEIVNDAKFNRNTALCDKYNIATQYINGGSDGAVVSSVTASVAAGDNAYSYVDNNAQFCIQMASKGVLLEISELPVIDLSAPYWNSLMLEGSSINHKNYFVFSDINIHAYGATPCMIFNKVVHENYGLEDLYEIVLNGGWTFDKACEMINVVTHDLDGDGKITKDDALGLIANNFCIDCFISGTGYQLITKDENDMPTLNVFTEQMADIMDGIKRVCSEQTGTFLVDRTSTATEACEYWTEHAITEDRALFWVGNIKCVERMRASESDFGVVPMPKYSDAQENYAVHIQANIGSVSCFPLTVAETAEMVGRVTEEMAYLSFRDVMPAYMDVCIDGKTIRDEESLACLEIIRSSYYCDLGFMFQQMGLQLLGNMRDYVTANKTDYMSSLKSSQKVWNKSLERIAKTFAEGGN